jgi:hypothetical protein
VVERQQGRFQPALRHLAESCRLAEEAGDWRNLAIALTSRGVACTDGWVQGQLPREALDEALVYHTRARDLFLAAGKPEAAVSSWNNLGAVYKAMDRPAEALAAYRAAPGSDASGAPVRTGGPAQQHGRGGWDAGALARGPGRL